MSVPDWISRTGCRLSVLMSSDLNVEDYPSDLETACLLRQATWEAIDWGMHGPFDLPTVAPWGPWPSREVLAKSNLTVTSVGGVTRVMPQPWTPDWLSSPSEGDPFALTFRTNPSRPHPRQELPTPTDPAIRDYFQNYRTPGQQEAIRASLGQPAGTTLTINLPTGTGKTLAVLAPALSFPGTTIVVVPTTALAIDQEQRLQDLLANSQVHTERYAYHGEMREDERAEFVERLKMGVKKVVFTSPEALLSSLRAPTRVLAEQGQLRALVIDEAHIVGEWGNGFRSEFQLLSGMRRWLLEIQSGLSVEPFRTVLLTGTLTPTCLETLHALFGEDQKHEVVASMGTRPELSYWIGLNAEKELRRQRLLETLSNTAMPCLVYVTRRTADSGPVPAENVQGLMKFIKDSGFGRVTAIDGGSSVQEKKEVIEKMPHSTGSCPSIDIAVANSAFGLGIDIEGLRSVIHVCVPETIERFYQEAGRAGRDGRHATHIWMPAVQDWNLARDLAKSRTLRMETARSRWESMYNFRKNQIEQSFTVDTRSVHSSRIRNGDTELNTAWNNRTLTLMAQARMIDLQMLDAPVPESDETPEHYSKRLKEFVKQSRLRVRDISDKSWEKFDAVRERLVTAEVQSVERVKDLGKTECMNKIFAEAFSIPDFPDGVLGYPPIESQYACAGCPTCRHKNQGPRTYTPIGISEPQLLATCARSSDLKIRLYNPDSPLLSDYIVRFLRHSVLANYTHIIVDETWQQLLPEFWTQLWDEPRKWNRPDVFIDVADLNDGIGFFRNYQRPTVLFPSPISALKAAQLIDYPAHLGRPSLLLLPTGLILENPRRRIQDLEHRLVEQSEGVDHIQEIR